VWDIGLFFGDVFAGLVDFGKNGDIEVEFILEDSLRGNHQKSFCRPLGDPIKFSVFQDRRIVN